MLIILAGPVVAIPAFIRMGLYRAVVRYLPERALCTMVRAVTMVVLLWLVVAFLSQFITQNVTPRSAPIIYWALACICIIGSRFVAKRILGMSGSSALPTARLGNLRRLGGRPATGHVPAGHPSCGGITR